VAPELNRRRAVFVLGKIDEILSWEKTKEEKDTRFVELGEYLCEVRSKQYWKLEKLKSFDEFLAKRFPESRRKAYYLMAIHENLPHETQEPTRRRCDAQLDQALRRLSRQMSRRAPLETTMLHRIRLVWQREGYC